MGTIPLCKLNIRAIIPKRSKNTGWMRNQPLERPPRVIVVKHCANQLVATMVISEDVEEAPV